MALQTLALIVAAGDGTRFGGDMPKPYQHLGGKSLLRRSMELFLDHPQIDAVRVVIRRADHARYKSVASGLTLFPCVVGGASRQASVLHGLESVVRAYPRYVLIHDAARPLVSAPLISRVVDALAEYPAVFPALPVSDTLRRATGEIVSREGLFLAQTPQGFHFPAILAAHRQFAAMPVTDDIALAEQAGLAVGRVAGERENVKLTTPDDLSFMERLLSHAS